MRGGGILPTLEASFEGIEDDKGSVGKEEFDARGGRVVVVVFKLGLKFGKGLMGFWFKIKFWFWIWWELKLEFWIWLWPWLWLVKGRVEERVFEIVFELDEL